MALDGLVHHCVIDAFLTEGRAPALEAIAARAGATFDDAAGALDRLHEGHGLVLHPGTHAVWIAHPFSASPTATWVEAGARGWWAPCLWCALGIAALAGEDVQIHTQLAGERDRIAIAVPRDGALTDELVVHFARPPRDAWDNVVHFCAMVLAFRDARAIDAWSARHGLPRGEAVPLAQVRELARRWYGGHAAADWRKHTIAEARQIFAAAGLTGPFWDLPERERF